MSGMEVSFTDEIPTIQRTGRARKSKYQGLLDACVERPGKAARIVVANQGQATSRASSIRTAAENHPLTRAGEGHFVVATRSGEGDDGEREYYVYTQYNEGPAEDDDTPRPRKKARRKS